MQLLFVTILASSSFLLTVAGFFSGPFQSIREHRKLARQLRAIVLPVLRHPAV